ncbi:MAG: histidine kinase dimerization/phosphoacceptor domain -containing protein [Synechococcales bacterium]|nr:histidine kinase dimerization/phosphoacceptor domain -containing protein [Synechococcales bacterium]
MPAKASHPLCLSLEQAIDRRPLTVSASAPLTEAIAMAGKAQSSCPLPSLDGSAQGLLTSQARAHTLLVEEAGQLVGVLDQPYLLRIIASAQARADTIVRQVMRPPAATWVDRGENDLFEAIALMQQQHIHSLPVLNDLGRQVGIITPASLRHLLPLDELLKCSPLASLKGKPVIWGQATTSVAALAQQMVEQKVAAAAIAMTADNGQAPVGLVLAQDIIQLSQMGVDLTQIQAQQIMGEVLRFPSSETILVAHWTMQQHHCPYALVFNGESDPVLISLTSFVQDLAVEDMQSSIHQLQASIQSFATEGDRPLSQESQSLTAKLLDNPTEFLEQIESIRLLSAIALHIRESLNLQEILQTAVDDVRTSLHTDRVLIYQFNPDMSGTVAVESVAEGWRPALSSTLKDTCFAQNYAHAYREGRIQVTEDIYTAGLTQCHIDILALFDVRASLIVPVLQGDHLWGLLCAYHCAGPRHWRSFEIDLLQQLATHMAIAIQQSELYEQLQMELTERRRAEEQIKASLKEKEVLLKEVHHRVKNNLQVISSVLRLQSDFIKDDKVLALFRDSQHRIRSMALIHEKLYQSTDLLRINFAEYVRDLTDPLFQSYGAIAQNITRQIRADNIWFNIDTAIPCGLIINELVSNSLKHAFKDHREHNQIGINIFPLPDGQFSLVVSDNGSGFPADIDFRNTESLGLELVCIFTEQLGGDIELSRDHGTTFTIIFAEIEPTGRV